MHPSMSTDQETCIYNLYKKSFESQIENEGNSK